MIEDWGHDPNGTTVKRLTIKGGDLSANVLTFGATLQDLRMTGRDFPLILGYPNLGPYLHNPIYFGSTIGRFANRIANGRADLSGQTLVLPANNGPHHLHGGPDGLSFRNWSITDHGSDFAELRHTLPDGHMGYPGNLRVSARFSISENALTLMLTATTDALTLCNLTSHPYFHLDDTVDLGQHIFSVNAREVCEVDDQGIPSGQLAHTSGTGLDFSEPKHLIPNGALVQVDHNYCLSDHRLPLTKVATLKSERSGLQLDLSTTEPGLQVYTMERDTAPEAPTADTKVLTGIALEPQIWPDAPNHKNFPCAELKPSETYRHVTRYAFRSL